MELHDLFIACQEYKQLLAGIHEGYQPRKEEIDFMNIIEEDWGFEETPYNINEEEEDD